LKRKIPRMENMIQIRKTIINTLKSPDKDPKSALTTIFRFLLCEMNLSGLKVLNSRNTFKAS